jgi:3-oxoacyl-[acyl-carrier-protein] synthase-3
VVLEGREGGGAGILSHAVRSDTLDHCGTLMMGPSYKKEAFLEALFLKMEGRRVYRYALSTVAGAIKEALERADVDLREVAKVLLHQANGKMDEAILGALFGLYGISAVPAAVMPMTISWLGNSSVATVPTLLDLVRRERLEGHRIRPGDTIVLASVGAGMHVNAVVYRES